MSTAEPTCPYPYCTQWRAPGQIACDKHIEAEEARREKIGAPKRGKARSAEARAKMSASHMGKHRVERSDDQLNLQEMKAASGRGHKVLAGWRDSGDAPGEWVPQPGNKPDVFLYDLEPALARLEHECELPRCSWPAGVGESRCVQHLDDSEVRMSVGGLAARADFSAVWLTDLLHSARPDLHGRRRPMTPRELDELLASRPRCRKRGCENPAGPTGACWRRGHFRWLRPRPELQLFGLASREEPCAGGCGRMLTRRGYQVARGKRTRCYRCVVRHWWLSEAGRRARVRLKRSSAGRFGAQGSRPLSYPAELRPEIFELKAAGYSEERIAKAMNNRHEARLKEPFTRRKVQRCLASGS